MDERTMKPVPPPLPVKLYECGTAQGCPRQNVNVCGVTFAAFRGTPIITTEGVVKNPDGYGQRHKLTDVVVKKVLERISHGVVRKYGTGLGDIHYDDSGSFQPAEGDERLGKYLWMVEITDTGQRAESEAPAPLSA
jgi:hypothetical protein